MVFELSLERGGGWCSMEEGTGIWWDGDGMGLGVAAGWGVSSVECECEYESTVHCCSMRAKGGWWCVEGGREEERDEEGGRTTRQTGNWDLDYDLDWTWTWTGLDWSTLGPGPGGAERGGFALEVGRYCTYCNLAVAAIGRLFITTSSCQLPPPAHAVSGLRGT